LVWTQQIPTLTAELNARYLFELLKSRSAYLATVAETVQAQKMPNSPQGLSFPSQSPFLKLLLAKIEADPVAVFADDEMKSLVLKLVSHVIE